DTISIEPAGARARKKIGSSPHSAYALMAKASPDLWVPASAVPTGAAGTVIVTGPCVVVGDRKRPTRLSGGPFYLSVSSVRRLRARRARRARAGLPRRT